MEYTSITTLYERNSGNKNMKKEKNRTKKKVVRVHDLSLDVWELIDITSKREAK